VKASFLAPALIAVVTMIWLNARNADATGARPVSMARTVVPLAQSAERRSSKPVSLLLQAERDGIDGDIGNPFVAKSWFVQPLAGAPVAPPPPPPPSAPPLPFSFAGTLEAEPGHVVYYLVAGDQSYAVSSGEAFAGQYRLAGIENGQLVIVYVPLGIKQFLPLNTDS
jgi:hypothetical protein